MSALFNKPISDIGFSARTLNVFTVGGVETVADIYLKEALWGHSWHGRYVGGCGLLKFRNFGRKSLRETEEKLKKLKLPPLRLAHEVIVSLHHNPLQALIGGGPPIARVSVSPDLCDPSAQAQNP